MIWVYFISSFLFLLFAIRNILFWVQLWQVKEYRLERMLIHLKETVQGRSLFFSPFLIIKILAILGYGFVALQDSPLFILVYQIAIVLLIVLQALTVFREGYERVLKRPQWTWKAVIISIASFFSIGILVFLPFFEKFLWLLILDRTVPILVAIFVFLFWLPTQLYWDYIIDRATQKIRQHKKLLVIAVTGSYGKSSTKEFIAQILEKKFKVIKTIESNNTAIGIAKTILSKLRTDTEIFVVEMGADLKGDIAFMCGMVKPKIGILTAVSAQHVSTYKNIENIKKAKYELIESLPKDGLAFFNGSNLPARDLFEKTKKKKILYQTQQDREEKEKQSFFAHDITVNKTSVGFTVKLKNADVRMKANLVGQHMIENVLPGVFIADALGMIYDEIKDAVSSLVMPKKTMNLIHYQNATFVDDTFNTGPDAISAALSYVKLYKKKKIMVLHPMIELGNLAKEEHYKIGKETANICDFLLLTNMNFYKEIEKGIKEGSGNCIIKAGSPSQLAEFIKETIEELDLVIFEGKEAGLVLKKLI